MGYFRPDTLSFNAPSGFFDNVGKTAPVTRFNIELPREYKGSPPADASPPYTAQPVDPQILDEIKTAVMREYGGVARQCLGAFRQGGNLSGLALTGRAASLDNGVGMKYVAQFGRENVTINVSAEAVRKLLGEEASGRCMLIMYGGNKIAAVKMSDITKSSFPVAYRKTSAYNWTRSFSALDWRNGPMVGMQLRFGPKTHIASMNMKINSDGSIADMSSDTKVYYYNTEYSLLDCVTRPDIEDVFANHLYFNGDAARFFESQGNCFNISATGKIVYRDRPFPTNYLASPIIADDGSMYDMYVYNPSVGTISFGSGQGNTQAQYDAIDAVINVSYPIARVAYSSSSGPGPNDTHATIVSGNLYGTSYTYGGGGAETGRVMVYTNDGKKDIISCEPIEASYSASGFKDETTDTTYGANSNTYTISAMGLSGTVTFTQASGPRFVGPGDPAPPPEVVSTYSGLRNLYGTGIVHYGVGFNDMWVNYGTWLSNGTGTLTRYTPFGVDIDSAMEWIFSANGKHQFSTMRYAPGDVWLFKHFLNRVDITGKVTAITGELEVDAVLLDIKLSDIKKLK